MRLFRITVDRTAANKRLEGAIWWFRSKRDYTSDFVGVFNFYNFNDEFRLGEIKCSDKDIYIIPVCRL